MEKLFRRLFGWDRLDGVVDKVFTQSLDGLLLVEGTDSGRVMVCMTLETYERLAGYLVDRKRGEKLGVV